MKIKFKTAQSTNTAPQIIIGKIVSLLDDRNYRINNVTCNIVEFDDSPWKLMWNHEAVNRLDGGAFEISLVDNQSLITFSYAVNLTSIILVFVTLSAVTLYNAEYSGILFFLVFYLIVLPIHIVTQRGAAKEMLASIISSLP